jgi:hypothetical protein
MAYELNAALEPFARIGRLYAEGIAGAPHPMLQLQPADRAMGGPEGLTVGDFLQAAEVSLGEPEPETKADEEWVF